jgi:glycosyltransferase involved in cell wall biosynthesis
MLIGLEATSILYQKAGVGYFTLNLIKSLLNTDSLNEYILYYTTPSIWKAFSFPHWGKKNYKNKIFWIYRDGMSHYQNIDIYHDPSYTHLIPPKRGKKNIISIYDLTFKLFPELCSEDTVRFYNQYLPLALKNIDLLIVCSQSTKNDFIEYFNFPHTKIQVVHGAVDKRFYPVDKGKIELIKKKYNIQKPYLLFASTIEPRKNIKRLLNAFSLLNKSEPNLVLVGSKGWLKEDLMQLIIDYKIQNKVHYLKYVSHEDLPALYSGALMFLYPSLYEGFGLPLLEAMACGTPVISSNISSIPEVVRDAGLLINPNNTEEIAEAIKTLLNNTSLREKYRKQGIEQAKTFTWEKSARITLNAYENLLK